MALEDQYNENMQPLSTKQINPIQKINWCLIVNKTNAKADIRLNGFASLGFHLQSKYGLNHNYNMLIIQEYFTIVKDVHFSKNILYGKTRVQLTY